MASRTDRLPNGLSEGVRGPDGSDWLFAQLDGRSESYLQYASEYFQRQLPSEAVTAVIEHRPLTAALVRALNPKRSHHDVIEELNRIGYPV